MASSQSVRFHGTSRSHGFGVHGESSKKCHVASRKDSEVQGEALWVATSVVWHPKVPFTNKIHDMSSREPSKNIESINFISIISSQSYADWPLPTGCAASQCAVLVREDGAMPYGRKAVTGPHIGLLLDDFRRKPSHFDI